MGVQGLTRMIQDVAPQAVKTDEIKHLFGRKVAIDASMSIYQFLIAVRPQDGQMMQNEAGETTSHLMGMFYRTLRMIDNGIKPVYVFDGKPPDMKSGELAKRLERRDDATTSLETVEETGDKEAIDKFSRRTVKVTKQHNEECKRLLRLMGIPVVDAPCEAEAQCAALAKAGKVYAAASEDMDTLAFGTPVLLRHLSEAQAKKKPIAEINLEKTLSGMQLTMDEFIDLCILLGCDYCSSIKGVGPKTAYQLIKTHKNIETIIENVDSKKYQIPENWPFQEARKLIKSPSITDPKDIELKWTGPDEAGLIAFLVGENQFNEDRIRKGIEKLQKGLKTGTQTRMEGFFSMAPPVKSAKPSTGGSSSKRKSEDKSSSTSKKVKSKNSTK